MRIVARLAMMVVAMALAGCWQGDRALYRGVAPVTPLKAGAVTEKGPDGKAQHYALTRVGGGRYRLTITDKGQDFGEGFELSFFSLPHAPKYLLVYEAAALDHPIGDKTERYYGLVKLTYAGADEIRPDCDKDARAAKASGTLRGKDGGCTFKDRAALEKSLLALWKGGKRADYSYRLDSGG